MNKKILIIMIIILVAIIIISVGTKTFIQSEVNSTPFEISRLMIVSTTQGEKQENINNDSIWNLNVVQNNDIYINISQKEGKELIDKIIIDSFRLEKIPQKGAPYIYGPNNEEVLFKNTEKNMIEDELIFFGGELTDTQNFEVTENGGMITLRCSNKFIINSIGDENYAINDRDLLKKSGITQEEIKFTISFYLSIESKSGKRFRTKITLDLPDEGIIQNGNTTNDINCSEFIFKQYHK